MNIRRKKDEDIKSQYYLKNRERLLANAKIYYRARTNKCVDLDCICACKNCKINIPPRPEKKELIRKKPRAPSNRRETKNNRSRKSKFIGGFEQAKEDLILDITTGETIN